MCSRPSPMRQLEHWAGIHASIEWVMSSAGARTFIGALNVS